MKRSRATGASTGVSHTHMDAILRPGGLRRPTSVAVGPDGEVYVPELVHRVTILDGDGNVLSRLGGESSHEPGQFVAPHCVAIDSHGDIYVGEVMTGRRIQKFMRRR